MVMLAIVPILLQSGATVVATVVAGFGSLFPLLFRPSEWLGWDGPKRKRALFAIIGIIAICAGFIVVGSRLWARSKPRTDWSQVALNIIHQQQVARRAVDQPASSQQRLQPVWQFSQSDTLFLSTPVVGNGRVYGASCMLDVTGTFGSIFCLDAATGQRVWQVDQVDGQNLKGIFSSPSLTSDGKYLIVGEGLHFDTQCHLICLEAATGKLHWKVDVPHNHVESSPAISADIVVAGAGAIERSDHRPVKSPGYVFAVRISDGRVLWQQDVVDPESSPVVTSDGSAYFGSGVNGCAVVAIHMNGDFLWRAPTPYPVTGPIVIANDSIVVGSGRGDLVRADPSPAGAVLSLDRNNGRINWRAELPDAVLGGVAIGNHEVFCPVRNGMVVALNLKDGKIIWQQKIGDAPVVAGAALSEGRVYTVSSDGFLVVLDANTGQLLEKVTLNDEANPGRQNLCLSSPVVANDRVFVGSETGGLRCFTTGPRK